MKKFKLKIKEIIVNSKKIIPIKKTFLLLFKKLWKELITKKTINNTDKNINIELLIIAISDFPIKVAT